MKPTLAITLLAAIAPVLLWPGISHAQSCPAPPPFNGTTFQQWQAACSRYGTPYGTTLYNAHCQYDPNWCHRGSAPGSGTSDADAEAERAREAERQRLEDAQRQLAEQQRLATERQQQEHEEWVRSVQEAAGNLKGVSSSDMQLKGVDDTGFFGLKGVTPDEALSTPNYGIKPGSEGGSPRSVTGAWQQLHCAAEFAGDAVADLRKIETGEVDARELDEIKFVTGQASAVMHGGHPTVDCSPAPPMAAHLTEAQLERETPIIDGLLTRTVHDAETYVAAQQNADTLRQKLDTLKAQQGAPPVNVPVTRGTSAPEGQPQSQTTETPALSPDQQHINQVYQQQKENERKKSDYLALLRETQRALNEANSQKVSSASDAERIQKEAQAILAGQFSSASGSTQNQTQKPPGSDQ